MVRLHVCYIECYMCVTCALHCYIDVTGRKEQVQVVQAATLVVRVHLRLCHLPLSLNHANGSTGIDIDI